MAQDAGGRPGFTTVRVNVGDENDNAPEFVYREYKTVIHGNMTLNTTFLKVKKKTWKLNLFEYFS
jgi:protocadherin Fat 1/2/3